MFVRRLIRKWSQKPNTFHLSRVLNVILALPISSRKIVITSCQTWEVDSSTYSNFRIPIVIDVHTHAQLSTKDFLSSLRWVVSDSVHASIVWMIARTCPEPPDQDEHEQVKQQGFDKEFSASQVEFSPVQQVSYTGFFAPTPPSFAPSGWWTRQAHEIRREFHSLVHYRVLFPQVNRTKNVSDETAAMFRLIRPLEYVRTVDLEVLYAETGIQVEGNCELREAWKFNDLKPRMYYAIGGQQYWASRYIKKIAVAIMEAIPSSFAKIRTDPTQFLSSVLADDFVVAWDFTSFTTTLSELKYFIWHLARCAEADGTTVTLFDYRLGFYEYEVWKLLDEYNQVANMSAPFEIHRMIGKYIEDTGNTFFQRNSGMLGVPGNIGFSTALHGYVICRECGRYRCVCVGDDALGITPEEPSDSLVPVLSTIGVIHPEKFEIIRPGTQSSSAIKFLKRRLERIGNLFTMSYLLNFPVTPYIDGILGHRTRPSDFSMEARIFKFSTHVSSLLWDVHRLASSITDEGVDTLLDFLGEGYKALRLPIRGLLPGHTLFAGTPESFQIGFIIPCIWQLDPRSKDWLDHLMDTSPSDYFQGPTLVAKMDDYGIRSKGDEGMLAESVWVSAMEDMGYYRVTPLREWFLVSDVSSKRLLKRMTQRVDDGLVKATYVECLKDIPARYSPVRWASSMRDSDLSEI